MSPILTALREFVTQVEANERECAQLRRDVERIANQNGDLCDELHELRAENERLREQIGMATTKRPGGER